MAKQSKKMTARFGEWWRDYWRPMCAVAYLMICVYDFLIMPSIYTSIYRRQDLAYIIDLVKQLEPNTQAAALTVMVQSREWKPISLQEGAFLHLAFGAILTGAAITRGMAQNSLARNGQMPWTQNTAFNGGFGNGFDNGYSNGFGTPNNFNNGFSQVRTNAPVRKQRTPEEMARIQNYLAERRERSANINDVDNPDD